MSMEVETCNVAGRVTALGARAGALNMGGDFR